MEKRFLFFLFFFWFFFFSFLFDFLFSHFYLIFLIFSLLLRELILIPECDCEWVILALALTHRIPNQFSRKFLHAPKSCLLTFAIGMNHVTCRLRAE